ALAFLQGRLRLELATLLSSGGIGKKGKQNSRQRCYVPSPGTVAPGKAFWAFRRRERRCAGTCRAACRSMNQMIGTVCRPQKVGLSTTRCEGKAREHVCQ